MDFDESFTVWKNALEAGQRQRAHQILEGARRSIPNSNDAARWDWFTQSLSAQSEKAGFVAALFQRAPIPRALFGPFLEAGLRFGNASTIAEFVVPCVESFGREAVDEWLQKRALELCEDAGNKIDMTRYHYPGARKSRR